MKKRGPLKEGMRKIKDRVLSLSSLSPFPVNKHRSRWEWCIFQGTLWGFCVCVEYFVAFSLWEPSAVFKNVDRCCDTSRCGPNASGKNPFQSNLEIEQGPVCWSLRWPQVLIRCQQLSLRPLYGPAPRVGGCVGGKIVAGWLSVLWRRFGRHSNSVDPAKTPKQLVEVAAC